MQKSLILLTFVFLCLPWGATAHAQESSEEAFQRFLDRLAEMKQTVIDRTPEGDGIDRAEGFRQIIRMIGQAEPSLVDDFDTAHPKIVRTPSVNVKLGMDNPDNPYLVIGPLSEKYIYRVFGTLDTRPEDELQTFYQIRSITSLGGATATVAQNEMVINEDGTFELFLSAEEPEGASNWLPITGDDASLLVRHYITDWVIDREPSLSVEVLSDDWGNPVPLYTPDRFGTQVNDLLTWLDLFDLFNGIFDSIAGGEVGVFEAPSTSPLGNPQITSSRAKYRIAEDEAAIVEVPVYEANYTNIQLGAIWWMSLDYASRQSHLNGAMTHVSSDEKIRYVIAQQDPLVANWLNAAGHPFGALHMRWIQKDIPNEEMETPTMTVVKLSELRDNLPANFPEVTEEERIEAIKVRQASYNRRTNPPGTGEPQCEYLLANSGNGGSSGCMVSSDERPNYTGVLFGLLLLGAFVVGRRSARRAE